MSQTLTESTNLAFVTEATLGAATPPTTGWVNLQPNSYGNFGPSYKKVPRDPISKNRQLQKGMLVDEDSMMPFESDITKDVIDNFLSGIFMSTVKHSGGTGVSLFTPTAFTATAITVAAGGALQQGTLIYVRNETQALNNGLRVVGAGSVAASIVVSGGAISASPPATTRVGVAGFRPIAAADIQMNASGNLTSTSSNFTTMGLNVNQWIWVGGTVGSSNAFATATYRGYARIIAITATLLTLDRRSWTVGAADLAAGKSVDIYFSRWARNVAIDSADYLNPSYAFEISYPNLGGVGVTEYEYPLGNMIDEWVWNLALTSKATVNIGMKGTTTADPSSSRLTGPSAATNSSTNLGLSTSTDLMRLRMNNSDETGLSTDFKSIKITMKNNVEAEKQLGILGTTLMNVGKFEVSIEAEVIFTDDDVIKGIRDNRTASMEVGMRNGDFGALIDVASMTMDSGDRKLETNRSVVISSKATGFQDMVYGYTSGLSMFEYLPSA